MKILAIDTSGETLSVAISNDLKIVAEYFYNAGKIHSDVIIPLVNKILKDVNWELKDIDKFALSCGPGSFTGIRVAMAVIKTLAQTLNKPVVCVDSLSVLENQLELKDVKVVAAIDALRDEVYVKQKNEVVILSVEKFVKNLKKYKNKIFIIGNASFVYSKIFVKELGKQSVSLPQTLNYPKASTLCLMAHNVEGVNFAKIEPLYVRKSWAEEKK